MKKILIGAVLLVGISTGLIGGINSITAEASTLFQTSKSTSNLPGSDTWTRGIKTPGNGWYLTYSYYHNASYSHNAGAYTKQHGMKLSSVASPGATATINAPSVPDYTNAYTRAGADKSGWKYVRDEGTGEKVGK
ncbi:hypothetical protein [uncultured Clostridium sp.]|uniref:hypothetical protein n=1 Tax=uncultured Clostridium sp. TaxID=59620 RepID=UPI00262A301D|nr:hypothetical protein [uncultured Clostridium sp.]